MFTILHIKSKIFGALSLKTKYVIATNKRFIFFLQKNWVLCHIKLSF